MDIKTKICRPEIKLNLGGYEKTFRRASSKNELLLVVRNKDEKWKHFSETYFLPEFNFFVDKYKDFEVREDDIIVSGFPRSGTTRAQEMVWLIANDCDFEAALRHESDVRCPYFE
jgi:calcineurin-like phosphoesterase family protein